MSIFVVNMNIRNMTAFTDLIARLDLVGKPWSSVLQYVEPFMPETVTHCLSFILRI